MKTRILAHLAVALLLIPVSSGRAADSAGGKPAVKHVKAEAAAKLLADDSKVVVLDIRTPDEFKAGHIKGATNLDFYADDFETRLGKLDREKSYLVHCASGGRSGRSLALFNKLGFRSVYHLDDGFKGWEKAGKPVARESGQ